MAKVSEAWWKEAIVYQIYPASFKDSTGNGYGDLRGITQKLDYLKYLGVDVIWLCPIYNSPMNDMGYDISDYESLNTAFGTMKDWDELLAQCHTRGIKLIMDLVVNHTSSEHAWFQESRDPKSDKRDWYTWKPPKVNSSGKRVPPSNWRAIFGGSAWEFDERSGEYYLHLFDITQPDLNWENTAVRKAVYDLMRFWLDKGINGFRMDVINAISKAPEFADIPILDASAEFQNGGPRYFNGPKVHEYLKEMKKEVLMHYDIMTVGETPATSPEQGVLFVARKSEELDMVFHFAHVDMDLDPVDFYKKREWKLTKLKNILGSWMEYMQERDGWNSLYLENHDQARSVSRFGNDSAAYRAISAKMLAMFHTTGCGTVYIYQGQEIGMANLNWTREQLRDVSAINYYDEKSQKPGVMADDLLENIRNTGRDNARSPMQWDDSEYAGFSTSKPWIRLSGDYKGWNVEVESKDDGSVLQFWRRAIQLRKQYVGLVG